MKQRLAAFHGRKPKKPSLGFHQAKANISLRNNLELFDFANSFFCEFVSLFFCAFVTLRICAFAFLFFCF